MKRKKRTVLILFSIFLYFFICINTAVWISEYKNIHINECYDYSYDKKIEIRKVGLFTKEEIIVNENGEVKNGIEINDAEIGDIFITASTHSFGWHHGHAAIVVGVNPLKTLEAESLGKKSRIIESPFWNRYSTFIQLRLKNENGGRELAKKAAEYATNNLTNIDYGLLCRKKCKCVNKVNCSFVVWRAFYEVGIDIDNDMGILVTPRDIYECNYFDIIERLGI